MTSVRQRWGWFAAALSIFFITGLASADWDGSQPAKWVQYPDLSQMGIDVNASSPFILADDFLCTETGKITGIHIWGSWLYDELPGNDPHNVVFTLSIHADIPATVEEYSRPGNVLWWKTFQPGEFQARVEEAGILEGWMDPPDVYIFPADTVCWQYNFSIDAADAFEQLGTTSQPIVYWLDVQAVPQAAGGGERFGWKTSLDHWNDDAVWGQGMEPYLGPWFELRYPPMHEMQGQSIDLAFVIVGEDQHEDKDYGDAPEHVLAYSDGTIGTFPTCINVGPVTSYIEHGLGRAHFGQSIAAVPWDAEPDGNGGLCPGFVPYDNDECFADGDAGLMFPEPFTIVGGVEVPCPSSAGTSLGIVCQNAAWGTEIDIWVESLMPVDGWVNVLMDWNRDGMWGGSSDCAGTAAPEWVLVDWPVPAGYVGPLSASLPPGFLIGPNAGYVWARFSITEQPIGAADWDGSGIFEDGETEDYLLFVEEGTHEPEPKWEQPPHGENQGFDAASDYWWQEFGIKWEQLPTDGSIAFHAHDYTLAPDYIRLIGANDWRCEGGIVTDFHWWGVIEDWGSGLGGFHVSIHRDINCLPQSPPDYAADIPIGQITVSPTPYYDSLSRPVFRYDFQLPQSDWYYQTAGELYWFDLCALSVDPNQPCKWLWMTSVPVRECPSMQMTEINGMPGPWQQLDLDFAFRVTSIDFLGEEVNKVVADDFISDGRPIERVYWAGSYLDQMYSPEYDPIYPYILDGWFISFHHADPVVNPGCPPDLLAGDPHPTVLAIYFAPVDAVTIFNKGYQDCLGHDVYDYSVDLSRCCLLCSQIDPRPDANPPDPGQPEGFFETSGFGYWLDIQAVVGVTWDPDIGCGYDDRILTGHVPSPNAADRHFWGWHTSYVHNLEEACTGRIVDMTPYPPDCWDYGEWYKQPWLCPPPVRPVDMAFALLAPPCDPMGDVNFDGVLDIADVPCFVDCLLYGSMPGCVCTCADMDGNGTVNGLDIQLWVDAVIP
ncbi:MAG: hypothetical protein ABII12_18760 [Planctomycetota bacterium]